MDLWSKRACSRLPSTIYLLGACLFAMGSSEFIISGVLPRMAVDLRVSQSTAGGLISAFALGVVIGAPPLALATLRWSSRITLVCSLVLFAATLAAGLLGGTYSSLFIGRFFSGVSYAAFWAVSAVVAVRLAPADESARALAVVVTGLSGAMVIGGPVGTLVGDRWGWRWAFYGVAFAVLLLAFALLHKPSTSVPSEPANVAAELAVFKRSPVWMSYILTLTTTAMYMSFFSYLGTAVTAASGGATNFVPIALLMFGIGAFMGLRVGAKYSDSRPFLVIASGITLTSLTLIAMGLMLNSAAVLTALSAALGFSGFLLNPAIMARVFRVAGDAPTLAGAVNVAAMQLGITLAPLGGGVLLNSGLGLRGTILIGLMWSAIAAFALGTAHFQDRGKRGRDLNGGGA